MSRNIKLKFCYTTENNFIKLWKLWDTPVIYIYLKTILKHNLAYYVMTNRINA